MAHTPPISRKAYALPIDPNLQIYHGGRGRTYLFEQLEMTWLDSDPLTSYAQKREYDALGGGTISMSRRRIKARYPHKKEEPSRGGEGKMGRPTNA